MELSQLCNSSEKSKGAVLILALILSVLCAAIAVEIAYSVQIEGERVATQYSLEKAELLSQAGYELAIEILKRDDGAIDSQNDLWNNPIDYSNENGAVRVQIFDESGKFPINSLTSSDGLLDIGWKGRFERLTSNLNMPEDLPDCVVDYIDPDDNMLIRGAEREYYERLEPPRLPANRRLMSLDELKFIKNLDDTSAQKLAGVTTLFPTRININSASPDVLSSLLPSITLDDANRISARRTITPFKNLSELNDIIKLSEDDFNELNGLASVSSTLFRIESTGRSGSSEIKIVTIVERQGADFVIKYRRMI
ncbi:TPA: hypothetical protein DEF17_03735 [bacterium]|nr:hypothetical protein [bacterium]